MQPREKQQEETRKFLYGIKAARRNCKRSTLRAEVPRW